MILILILDRISIATKTLQSDTKVGEYLQYIMHNFFKWILWWNPNPGHDPDPDPKTKKILKNVCGTKINFMSIINNISLKYRRFRKKYDSILCDAGKKLD